MGTNRKHKAFLSFVSKMTAIPSGYSREDLIRFRDLATREFPSLVQLIDQYVDLARRSEVDHLSPGASDRSRPRAPLVHEAQPVHLFDLLRSRKLFPTNTDLADFAGRILPGMVRKRFDKMSRGDISARIIEYLETLEPHTKRRLEVSMRQAASSSMPKRKAAKDSFFSEWEQIIKGIKLQ